MTYCDVCALSVEDSRRVIRRKENGQVHVTLEIQRFRILNGVAIARWQVTGTRISVVKTRKRQLWFTRDCRLVESRSIRDDLEA